MTLRRHAAMATGIALLGSLAVGSPAGANAPASAPPTDGRDLTTVTLLTGDQVRVADGRVAGIRMAPGRETQRVWQYELNGHEYVVPVDAAPLVEQGRLDRRLFDVTELVRQGLDDAATPALPLIIEGAVPAPAASTRTASVPALGLVAVDTPKAAAATAWRELRLRTRAAGTVWLNGRVRPTLEDSVPQVGAPEAWAAGFRGDGAKVAVLDTGYDAAHPDLASTVDAARDFTGEGVADTVGHGTHVASTIAGAGADGRHKGVAPGARLLIGKVLGEYGGSEADVIAGMQWAVEQGADVVNMSLGSDATDGTDPMSRTLNELSDSGTLFVVAAGNAGARGTVGSPGTADRALTVGSVTKDDQLSVFSSQGPRIGDHGLKPELVAPGSEIVAARAAGTNPADSVDEHYARLSGTSMATPHVAGAAAILAGQHPDWSGEQIKHALVGSAERLEGIDTYAQGAGRLDIARGVTQQVRAEGVLGFGEAWAGESDELARKVTYVNDGGTPVELDLDLRVDSELFTVDSPTVTVPARGRATVTVTARIPDEPAGELSGALVATAPGVALSTPLTASLPGEAHTLTVRVLPRDGEPVTSLLVLQDERTGVAEAAYVDGETATFTVPAGRYRVVGRSADFAPVTDTLFVLPADVRGDTELVVDTKQGKEITSSIDDKDARAQLAGRHAVMSVVAGTGVAVSRHGNVSRRAKLYAIGGPRLDGVSLHHFSYWTHPFATVTVDGPDGFEFEDAYVSSYPRLTGTVSADLVFVGNADRAAIDAAGDVRGKIALIAPPDWTDAPYPDGRQLRDGIALLAERGATLVLSHFNPQWDQTEYEELALPVVMLFHQAELEDVQARLAQGPVRITVTGRANSPVAYFLADSVDGRVPAGHAFRFERDRLGSIDRQLVDTLPDRTYRFHLAWWSTGRLNGGAEVEVDWPHRRTDYVSPGAALSMHSAGAFGENVDLAAELTLPVTLKRGEKRTSRIFAAPFGPELTTTPTSRQDGEPLPWAYRQGDRLTLSVPMFADSDPGNVGLFDATQHGGTVVLADGAEIGRRDDVAGLGTFNLPAGPGRFQVIADASRTVEQVPALSPRTRAEWTFSAPRGTGERVALPLLDVRFALPLDDHNRAAAGSDLRGGVTVVPQPGSRGGKVRSVRVEVSYDEGKTWERVRVDRKGDGWTVRIPRGGAPEGFASLRASATDSAGNAVTETVTRAYALR